MYDVKPVTSAHTTACGPTCLKMLLDFYGHDAALEDLITECGVGIAGCTANDLKRVGNAHGLDITQWKMDMEGVLMADRPMILWWRYQHFVVFCGLNDKGEPVICNPSSGRFPISLDTFKRAFSGIALCNGTPEDYKPRAAKAIAKGELFSFNNELCKAIAPIANGAILTLNTNYTVTSVEAELAALNK